MKKNVKQLIPASAVSQAREDWEMLRDAYLRERGWEYTSDNPGALWAWHKKLDDGRDALCDAATAFHIQEALTPDPEEEGSRYDDCRNMPG